jgi:serine/threonine-protein kinase
MFISLTTPAASTATGTLAVESPIELRLIEDGHVLGLSNGAPLVFSRGKHKLELVSDALEMRLTRTVTVESGKADRLSIPAPNGTVFINASPWADVSVDGRSIGVTPLGDVSVPVGSHEVLWRHPQLGERRRTVNVGAQTPVRLTMDMTR